MLIINKEDRIPIWTNKPKYLHMPIHPLYLNQYKIHAFQILLLKHVHIIIKIEQISIKTDKQMSKKIFNTQVFLFHV